MRITASHIVDWANTKIKDTQTVLPRLVRRLCFDVETTRQLSFPAGDSTYVPGWDGILFSERGNAWIPVGASRWEIGCDQSVTTKANEDYQKRLAQTNVEERSAATFVFVTPRRWTKKSHWIAEQRTKSEWADVRAYDADDLEQWLEQTPAVALQFAAELGLSGWGVESLSRYWQLWSQQCSPAITPDALFMDRTAARDSLMKKIREALPQQSLVPPIVIRADSAEEAAAFAVATLIDSPELADQSLIITESEGWRFAEANQQLKIAIAARPEAGTNPVLRPGLLIVIPYAAGDLAGKPQGEEVILERPNIYEFEQALIAIGMEESDAKRYALSTGRSWTVLRRQCATNPAIRRPAWLDVPHADSLALLCLLGAWHTDREADRLVVERVAAKPYDEIERDLRYLAQLDDAPLLSIGAVWKAKSPLELLGLFGDRITSGQLDRFFLIAKEMLAASDPQLELPDEKRYAASIYGKVRSHSGLLFESICDALVKLAVRGPEQPGLRTLEIEERVGRLVHELLDAANSERWLSLASYLPTLAEASPEPFLSALEKSLQLPDAPVTRLLTETSDGGFGGRCWHAGLLWALEILAWAPRRLARVALILAQLSHVQIKGNWGNTPNASLFGLFRSWLPQTAAGVQERIKVLDLLIEKDEEAALGVLEKIVSPHLRSASPADRPKWRDDDAGAGRGATCAEKKEMEAIAKVQLFQLSDGHPARIASLLQHISLKNCAELSKMLALCEPFTLPAAADEDREILRGALRNKIHWHRNYDDTPSEELNEWLRDVETCYARLTPVDLVRRHRWLFDSHWPELPSRNRRDDDLQAEGNALTQARTAALTEIWQSLGMPGIEALITRCVDPYNIGTTLAGMNSVEGDWADWIVEKGGDFSASPMTWCIAGFFAATPTPRSLDLLREVIRLGNQRGWDAAQRGRFLVLARSERETWQLVTNCGIETSMAYWKAVQPGYGIRNDTENLEFVLQHLMDAMRPRTALQFCRHDLGRTSATLLFVLLQQFLAGEEQDGPRLETWHLGKMLERLEQSGEIEKTALIQLEFALFPALGYGQEAKAAALYEEIMVDPTLFAELICLVYKPEHGNRNEPVTDAAQAAATRAWEILYACSRQPGTRKDGSIDFDVFIQFIDATREQCRQADRLTMCDQTLGQILARAPADEDGTWPFLLAREVLDRPELEEMRRGFAIGARNNRGVTTRSPFAGGDQERDLAAYYRGQAERSQHSQPKVAAMLEGIAKSYEHDGKREDVEAKLRREGY